MPVTLDAAGGPENTQLCVPGKAAYRGPVSTVDTRVAHWVDVAAEMLTSPITEFPLGVIGRGLMESFDTEYGSANWRLADGTSGLETVTRPGSSYGGHGAAAATELMAAATKSALLDHHPLVRWFIATGSGTPQSMSRVPDQVRTARSVDAVELLHAVGSDQELAIPLHLHGASHYVLVVGRSGRDDFSADDMEVAGRLQPLLLSIQRQAHVLGMLLPAGQPVELGLTGRELVVLRLLATGRTSGAIGTGLGCSGRTVQKHVEHIYRNLAVTDRVSAVRIGREAGLIGTGASRYALR